METFIILVLTIIYFIWKYIKNNRTKLVRNIKICSLKLLSGFLAVLMLLLILLTEIIQEALNKMGEKEKKLSLKRG